LSILFQADNDLKRIIVDATLRREPRIDFQTAQAARLELSHRRARIPDHGGTDALQKPVIRNLPRAIACS
jgi:hypothetical protein